jgi:hypothetical protein
MAKDVTNRRAKEHVDDDQNGVIVAGPEAHAREHAGKDPSHKTTAPKGKDSGSASKKSS